MGSTTKGGIKYRKAGKVKPNTLASGKNHTQRAHWEITKYRARLKHRVGDREKLKIPTIYQGLNLDQGHKRKSLGELLVSSGNC